MSEFKYACPVCGQHMKCDSSQSGTVMECPTCFQKITAPQAPATDDPKFIITGTKTGERPISAALAKAGLMTPAPEPEKTSPMAVIALVVLLCAVVAAAIVLGGKIFKPEPPPSVPPGGNSVRPSPPEPVTYTLNLSVGSDGNFALNKPAFASSQEDGHPVQHGNDGNIETRWCAANSTVPQWWEVDLGGAINITNTQVTWESVSIYQYQIEVSSNNTNWTTVVDKSSNLTVAKKNSDNFSASGRYVKVVVTGLQPGSWASFFEFRVLGSFIAGGDGGTKTNGNSTNQP